jgi:hypothetical protein
MLGFGRMGATRAGRRPGRLGPERAVTPAPPVSGGAETSG